MTTITKIFAFIVAVCAIAFTAASIVMVQKTENWQGKCVAVQKELSDATVAWDKTKGEIEELLRNAKNLADQKVKEAEDIQGELGRLDVIHQNLLVKYKDAQKRNQALNTAVNEINDRLKKQANDIETLRREKEDYRLKCEAAIRAREKAEDNLKSCSEDLSIERQKVAQLAKELGIEKNVITRYEEKAPDLVVERDKPEMPDIAGKIIKVDNTQGIVLISIGKNDGVQDKYSFEVFRPGQYVGRVWVFEIYDERAICRIDPTMTKGQIMENDYVSTRLQK